MTTTNKKGINFGIRNQESKWKTAKSEKIKVRSLAMKFPLMITWSFVGSLSASGTMLVFFQTDLDEVDIIWVMAEMGE
jgi:hypothetical protein